MKDKLIDKIDKNSKLFLGLSILVYFVVFSILSLKKYQGFDYDLFDLSIYNQVFFNTASGRFFDLTINLHNYLGDHFEPMIILLLPIYFIKMSPITLLFLQSSIVALAAWPLYLIAKNYLARASLALLVAVLWLLNPFVHSANLYEFHLLIFLPFFLFWTFYFYQKNNFKLFILFFILTLLIREDVSLSMLSFALLAYLDKKNKKWIYFSLFSALIYFFLATSIVSHFSVDGNYTFLAYYSWLGGETLAEIILAWLRQPLAVLAHVFSFKNIFNILFIFLPFLFIPFLRPKYLLISTLALLEFLLASAGFNFMVYGTHYAMFFMPAIFLSLVYSLKYLLEKREFLASNFVYKNFGFFKIVFLISVIYFGIFISPASHLIFKNYSKDEKANKNNFISLIPKDSKVAADLNILPKLSSRQTVYPIYYTYLGFGQFAKKQFSLPQMDYLLIDSEEFLHNLAEKNSKAFWLGKERELADNWRNLLANYALIKSQDDMTLWADKNKASDSLLFYELNDKLVSDDLLVFSDYKKNKPNILKIGLNKKDNVSGDILIRFYRHDKNYFDVPIGYGAWPVSSWPDTNTMTFYYYLSDDVSSFQIFQWSGEAKLGLVKEASLILDLKPLSELVTF